jgi:cytoskeletal protein RodZ
LRTYARFLGLDPEEAVAEFNRTQPQSAPGRPGGGTAMEPQERSPRRTGLAIWIAAAVAVVLVAVVVYQELTFHQEQAAAVPAASPTEASSAALSPSPAPAPSPTPLLGGAKSLALVLSAPSWLRVTVDGSVSMEGTFPAGTSKTFHGKSALVRIGNAGGVEVYVDGQDRGKLGKSGDVVEQAFTL